MVIAVEARRMVVNFLIFKSVIFALSRNNKRSSRFINQDGVDFIHNTVIESTLNLIADVNLHVVAEVVESEFVVCAVCDVVLTF